jgi:hypothetical protein
MRWWRSRGAGGRWRRDSRLWIERGGGGAAGPMASGGVASGDGWEAEEGAT